MFRLLIKVSLLIYMVCLIVIGSTITTARTNSSFSEAIFSKYSWALQRATSTTFTLTEMSTLLEQDKELIRDDAYGCWWTKSDPKLQICTFKIIREDEIEELDAISLWVGNNRITLGEAINLYGEPVDYSLNGEYITLNLESNIGVTGHLSYDSSKPLREQILRIDPTMVIDNLHYPGSITKAYAYWRGFTRLILP